MSRSSLILLRNLALVALCGAGGYLGILAVKRVLATDPIAEFRGKQPQNEDTGVAMTNFDWRAYNGSVIVAQGHVAKAEMGRDRDEIKLTTVSKGKYYDNGKPVFNFQSQSAVYFSDTNRLNGTGKTRVFNQDMDIVSAEFKYDPEARALTVPTPLVGKLQGGDMKAQKLTYQLKDKSFLVSGARWSGVVAQDQTKRKWTITAPDGGNVKGAKFAGAVTTFTEFKATDGEIIVTGDGGEYNKETDILIARGHVKYFGPDSNLACDEATIYRKEKKALLKGAVDMLIKPKQGGKAEQIIIPPVVPVVPEKILQQRPAPPSTDQQKEQEKQLRDGENVRDYPITVTAQRIEYWYGKGNRRAVITGAPQARQEFPNGSWRMVWATSAYYDGEKEILDLKSKDANSADVRMLNSIGDDMHAINVVVSTKEGADMMDASGVQMEMTFDDEDIPKKGETGGDGRTPPPIRGRIKNR